MGELLRVLIIEDSEDDSLLMLRELKRGGYEVKHKRVDTPPGMKAALDKHTWDIVLSDHRMPKFSAPAALELLKKKDAEQSLLDTSEAYHSLLEELVTAVREVATDPPSGKGLTRPEKIRALQKIISGISHEYNNLFAIIQGNPDLAQSGLEQNKEIAEGLKMLSKATKEGAEAVNRIYESARLKEG